MKRFHFDLEKLLELRAYREREAEQELAKATGELAAIEASIRSLAEDRVSASAERFHPGSSAADMRNVELYILRLDKMKEDLLESAARAELAVSAARDAYLEASRDRKVLDKLKEKRVSEYRKSLETEEIKVIDDISGGAAIRRAISGETAGILNT